MASGSPEMDAVKFDRGIDRACWNSLDRWQKSEYRKEAMFLHRVYRMAPAQAVRHVRRMVRIGSWK